ncbi:hypothetical protein BRPE64_ACDS08490 [Caballeronia insecticola]|uniref:Uncharacterized protein n=1 Tax=Caballeronia insecticola TaxID=758793 RepID=R4WFT4_9BURK|nr:hypothetical protein BRPE64_ACDS08490 [Caballeronia insecticola]
MAIEVQNMFLPNLLNLPEPLIARRSGHAACAMYTRAAFSKTQQQKAGKSQR